MGIVGHHLTLSHVAVTRNGIFLPYSGWGVQGGSEITSSIFSAGLYPVTNLVGMLVRNRFVSKELSKTDYRIDTKGLYFLAVSLLSLS
jgi:quinol-cytochrome oxidoreductase complex cytochrome b subunit